MANEDELRIIGDIEGALNFNELYKVLRRKKVITGSKCNYEADYLIDKIDLLREELEDLRRDKEIGELTPERIGRFITENKNLNKQICNITKSEKLRAKVKKLAIEEVMEKKEDKL